MKADDTPSEIQAYSGEVNDRNHLAIDGHSPHVYNAQSNVQGID